MISLVIPAHKVAAPRLVGAVVGAKAVALNPDDRVKIRDRKRLGLARLHQRSPEPMNRAWQKADPFTPRCGSGRGRWPGLISTPPAAEHGTRVSSAKLRMIQGDGMVFVADGN